MRAYLHATWGAESAFARLYGCAMGDAAPIELRLLLVRGVGVV